ncbi:MAG: bifunctional adenosylcobinamide kinase/adenosylcobinamide-phosphate guanylyltransferase [Clostridiales bacterium]|nr:bifunctional adenosylcobinamide kinase/adenosylcobinamide-phosphate guanylyltransferase [Clostridiales bacterium]
MDLIIGGAYQGKLNYAVNKYGFSKEALFDLSAGFPDKDRACFYHLEALTRRAAAEGLSPDEIVKSLLPHIKNAVVISREVGCGIVPTDKAERLFRETHGAVLRKLAEKADSVTRIFCGLEERLK